MISNSLTPRTLFTLTALATAISAQPLHAAEQMPPPEAEIEQKNLAPVISTSSLSGAKEGQRYQHQIDATDPESSSLSYRLLDAPSGMSISSSGQINWLPEFDAAGSHNIKVQVSDGELETSATLRLHVKDTNRPPAFDSTTLAQGAENSSYSAQLQASDADGDNVSFTLKSGPDGLTLSNSGKLSWKPDYNAAGTHSVSVSISDGKRTANADLQLTIANTNRAPALTTSKLSNAREDAAYTAQLSATDADGDAVSYSLINGPAGLSVSSTGELSWTPDFDAAGKHTVEVSVSDGDQQADKTLSLTVENTNRAPAFGDNLLDDGAENNAYTAQLTAEDADGDALSYSLVNGPAGLSISKTGKLSWTPGFDAAGSHTINAKVSDGKLSATQSLLLTIANTNRAPAITTSKLAGGKEDAAWSAQLSGKDADGDALSYALISGPQGLTMSPDGALSWTPDFDAAGSHPISVSISDGEATAEKNLTLAIANTNRAPMILSEANTTGAEAEDYSYTIQADDADGESVSLKLIKAPQDMTLSGNTLSWKPNYNQAGEHNVTIQASDAAAQVKQDFTISIANTNRAPSWKTSSLTAGKENKAYSTQLSAGDADGDALSYTLENGPQGMTLSPQGKLSWQPDFDAAGEHPISVSVADAEASVPLELTLSIANTNRKPLFTSEPVKTGAEAEAYSYPLTATDADGDPLTLTLVNGPTGLTLEGDALTWQPNYDHAGAYNVTVKVSDGQSSSQQKYLLKIANTNRAPEILPPGMEKLSTRETSNFTARIGLKDADGDTIQLKLIEGPQGLTLAGNQLRWKPTYEQAGEHSVLLQASDREDSIQAELNISVANLNRKPVILNKPALKAVEDTAYNHQVKAKDADQTPLSYSLLKAPEGLMIDESGLISWLPGFEQAGKHSVQLEVSDGEASASQSFTLSVADTNRKPIFNSEPISTAEENSTYSYSVEAVDPDRKPVKLTLNKAPQGMRLNNNTLSWKPDFDAAGDYPIVITANDGRSQTQQSFTLTVSNTNRLPEFTSTPKTRAMESVQYSYKLSARDADGESLTLRLNKAPKGMTIADGSIQWMPDFEQAGNHAVSVIVSDGIDDVEQRFAIDVINTNREPTFNAISDRTLRAGKTFTQKLSGSDVDGAKLSYKIIYGPTGLRITEGNTLYWETAKNDAGTHTIIVSASDGDLKVRKHFDLTLTRD